MASIVLLLSELLKHQSPDPHFLSSPPPPPPPPPPPSAASAPPYSPANWVVSEKSPRNAMDNCNKEKEEAAVDEDLPESMFCADLVWP
ncbi:hypothetical protein CsSME_00032008 [Camellia sinensis var. sinensis]